MRDGRFTLGGTVTYAGLLAARLGLHTAIVTSCGPDLPIQTGLGHMALSVQSSPQSTTFQNVYDGAVREQHLLARADVISLAAVPIAWRASHIVLLGPVAGELDESLFSAFDHSLLGLTPQGMMRAWDEDGLVYAVAWERAESLLSGVDVLVLREDDLSDPSELTRYTGLVDIVAVTDSERGATIYERGKGSHFPAYECDGLEPTGAGDTFAAAFLIELEATGSIERAARFANSAASFVIESEGASGLPNRSQVEQRIAQAARTMSSP